MRSEENRRPAADLDRATGVERQSGRRSHGQLGRALFLGCALVVAIPTSVRAEEADLSPAFKAFLAGNVSSHAADLGTTLLELKSQGVREGNPALAWSAGRPWAMGAVKASAVGLSTWAKVETYRRGHTKLAWIWLAAETGVITFVALRNHRLSR